MNSGRARRLFAAPGTSTAGNGGKLRRAHRGNGVLVGVLLQKCGDIERNPGPAASGNGALPGMYISGPGVREVQRRGTLSVATLNVRGLRGAAKRRALALSLEMADVDVCVLAETRVRDGSDFVISAPHGTRYRVWCGPGGLDAGVGLAVREAVADGGGDWHVEEVRVESSRMVTCKVVGPTRFFLVGVYAPRGGRDEDHDLFLREVAGRVPGGPVVVAGDLNGHIQYVESKPTAHKTTEAGTRVWDFVEGLGLCDAVRCFKAPAKRRKHTYRSRELGVVNGVPYVSSTLDYVLCSREMRTRLRRARVLTPALASDHRMVRAVFVGASQRTPEWSRGTGRSGRRSRRTRARGRVAGRSTAEAFGPPVIPRGRSDCMWQSVRSVLCKQQREVPTGRHAPYVKTATWDLLRTQIRARRARDGCPTAERREAYAKANQDFERALRCDRRDWLDQLCCDVEDALVERRIHDAFTKLAVLRRRRPRGSLPSGEQLEAAISHVARDRRFVWERARNVTAGPSPGLPNPPVVETESYIDVYTDGSQADEAAGWGVHSSRGEWRGRVGGAQTAQRGEVMAVAVGLYRWTGPFAS